MNAAGANPEARAVPASATPTFWPLMVRRSSTGISVKIHWKSAAVWLFFLAPIGWLTASAGAFFFVKYNRGFADANFIDIVLLPIRWEKYQVARGDFYIRQGKEQLTAGKYREAFYNIRLGTSKSPGNQQGRLLLVQFYSVWKRPDLAESTLLQGLKFHAGELDYLKSVFTFLLRQHRDEKVLELYNEYSNRFDELSDNGRLIGLAAATAYYFRGNYSGCEQLLSRYKLESTRDGRLILCRIDWERGDPETAISRLKALASDFPNDSELYLQLGTYLRELGRFAEARRESLLRSLNDPGDAQSRIDLLYSFHRDGDNVALATGIEEIFRNFATNSSVLNALADFAANTGNPSLATRVYNYCRSNGYDWERSSMMTVESYIVAKQYQAALEMVRQLLRDNPDWARRYSSVFNGLQAIALNGLGDSESAQVFVNNYIGQTSIRAEDLVAVSTRLSEVGAYEQARQVLNQAVRNDPLNQTALTSLIALEIRGTDASSLSANLRKLLQMRKAPMATIENGYRHLSSDIFLYFSERTAVLNELKSHIIHTKKSS